MNSVTQWIHRLKGSTQQQTAGLVWERFVRRLLRVSRLKLGDGRRTVADEEDVAIQAFADLLNGIRDGRFSQLEDRNDLWQILIMLAERRAISQNRKLTSQKLGGRFTQTEMPGDLSTPDPDPEVAALLAEEFNERLRSLKDDLDRQIATMRMQGYSNEEIADRTNLHVSSIERKLRLIRQCWEEQP